MLSAVVLPERGAMNAVMVSSQDANRAGPRPEGRLRSPSSSPVSAAGSDRGLAPASDGRSLMAVLAAGTGVSGVICGSPASAATGSPGLGMRAAMIRHAMIPAVMTAHASTAAISATRMVGVPGHAWLVRQRARLMTHRSLNGGMRRRPGLRRSGRRARPARPRRPGPSRSAAPPRPRRRCRPGAAPAGPRAPADRRASTRATAGAGAGPAVLAGGCPASQPGRPGRRRRRGRVGACSLLAHRRAASVVPGEHTWPAAPAACRS